MKKSSKTVYTLITSFLLTSFTIQAQTTVSSFEEKGKLGPKENFTGNAWMNLNVHPDEDYNANVVTVTFEPKARTNWHQHKTGQVLFVLEGTGYYQEKGQPKIIIKKGDVVKCPTNVTHWHGASPDSEMKHIAFVTDFKANKTIWLEPVTDEEYYQDKK